MTGEKALDLLMKRLGNRTDPALRETCALEMQLVQETVLEQGPLKPWFMLKRLSTTVALTVNNPELSPPSDFIDLDEEGNSELIVVNSDGEEVILSRQDYAESKSMYDSDAVGETPEVFDLLGDKFILFPTPTTALDSYVRNYYAKQTLPNDNAVETSWLKYAPDLLIAETAIVMASKHVQVSAEKEQGYHTDAAKAWDRLNKANTARRESGRERNMG